MVGDPMRFVRRGEMVLYDSIRDFMSASFENGHEAQLKLQSNCI